MTKEYLFDNERLVIVDPDLNIYIKTSFKSLLLLRDHKVMDGVVMKRDESGRLLSAYFEVEGKREGQFHRYHPNGKVAVECFYSFGLLHGPSRFYSETGSFLSETWFYKDRKEGESKKYYSLGQLFSIERFKRGVLHGKQEYYYEDGRVKSTIFYYQGKLDGMVTLYWSNGEKKRQCHFEKGVREGYDRMWNDVGRVLDEGEYKGGNPVGLHRRFYENGALREERFYYTQQCYDHEAWDRDGNVRMQGRHDFSVEVEDEEKKDGGK